METNQLETKAYMCLNENMYVINMYDINDSQFSLSETYTNCEFSGHINFIDCFDFYQNNGRNRFFDVSIFGDCIVNNAIIFGSTIKINKEINLKEFLNGKFTNSSGTEFYYHEGLRHQDTDLPAVIYSNGKQEWWKDGKLHRDGDLPAIIYNNGTKQWLKNDKFHRDGDLPAIITSDGTHEWWKYGKRHRDSDLPAVITSDGIKQWWTNDKLHRDCDLPAVIHPDGTQYFYKNGKKYTIKLKFTINQQTVHECCISRCLIDKGDEYYQCSAKIEHVYSREVFDEWQLMKNNYKYCEMCRCECMSADGYVNN